MCALTVLGAVADGLAAAAAQEACAPHHGALPHLYSVSDSASDGLLGDSENSVEFRHKQLMGCN